MNALASRFPESDAYLCLFHMAQATFVQVQKKGLLPVYHIQEARELLRCFVSLACLPPDEVVAGNHDIVNALNKLVDDKVVHSTFKPKLKGTCGLHGGGGGAATRFKVIWLNFQSMRTTLHAHTSASDVEDRSSVRALPRSRGTASNARSTTSRAQIMRSVRSPTPYAQYDRTF